MKKLIFSTTIFATVIFGIAGGILYITFGRLPDVRILHTCFTASMHRVYLCPKSDNYVSFSNISGNLKNAVLVSEDVGFYSHNGFELEEMKESMKKNLKTMSFSRGGSTITQQLVENAFLTSQKTLLRKFREMILTTRVENSFSKREIFEKYLNVVQFGKSIHGIKPASLHYFKKSPYELSALESAYLAYLLPNPEKHSRTYEKQQLTKYAKNQIQTILSRMYYYEKISKDQYDGALAMMDGFLSGVTELSSGEDEDTYEPQNYPDEITPEVTPKEEEPSATDGSENNDSIDNIQLEE